MKLARTFLLSIAFLLMATIQGWSQPAPAKAFDNVIIHTTDGQVIEDGTIVWRNGVISAVGRDVSIPFDAYVRDGGDSLHVYPGFIDGLALWGSPKPPEDPETPDRPGDPTYKRAGIQPQLHPANVLKEDAEALKEAPKYGFTTAALGLKGQMLASQIDLFFISGEQTEDQLLERGLGIRARFEEAGGSAYPSTTMGVMAQFRQLFYDARAQMEQQNYFASVSSNYPAPKQNKVLEALYPVMEGDQPFYFVADSKENIERMFWLQDELGFEVVLVSGKEAYKQAKELKERGIPVLASIDFPEKPDWMKTDEEKEDEKDKQQEKPQEVTDEMRAFRERQKQAYNERLQNISKLKEAGVQVGYASNGLKLSEVQKNLKILKEKGGLNEQQILQILTQSTADILGYDQKMGSLEAGQIASFTVFNKPFLEEKARGVYSVTNGSVSEIESESSEE